MAKHQSVTMTEDLLAEYHDDFGGVDNLQKRNIISSQEIS